MPSPAQTLYVRHSPWLLLFLRRRLGNGWDAADLLHDTFLRVLRRPVEFDSQVGERSYLATIAKGLCIDHWRHAQIERAWRETLAAQPEATVPSAEHTALVIETLFEVDAMLSRLPAKVREAFLMAQVEGVTYAVIAERLEVSERMVKKYMAQAFLHCAVLEAELDGLLVE
ncbi:MULTISPECIES: sigma-70 family RNA polymerase sigma factor [unclassified Pseudomonas]|uniref:sigma-70 family RNA polymerase sigma factor n=1 Tax=unclassified Pseudomonas TaxID=196821 RepID=UPI000BA33120|nr:MULTISPECIES: sigma-70 family RNA polymerase sigma factor [unclassified Pseudomonas]MCU1724695.1 sigma-70 family RNA polymerase sigma factor [Pseudomonas sp. 5P_5.1_Bac1]MCU1735516.1 sigma-70 family RNA polymerase sigma factor [Pseudomonas sp. 20P_3.2_Bac4]MCU1747083.1 sigma-70 family RNA polymerase sigma factor [Pseudomonas sp. 20P_3.2_Bac5]